jgi:hypothetical protein
MSIQFRPIGPQRMRDLKKRNSADAAGEKQAKKIASVKKENLDGIRTVHGSEQIEEGDILIGLEDGEMAKVKQSALEQKLVANHVEMPGIVGLSGIAKTEALILIAIANPDCLEDIDG